MLSGKIKRTFTVRFRKEKKAGLDVNKKKGELLSKIGSARDDCIYILKKVTD